MIGCCQLRNLLISAVFATIRHTMIKLSAGPKKRFKSQQVKPTNVTLWKLTFGRDLADDMCTCDELIMHYISNLFLCLVCKLCSRMLRRCLVVQAVLLATDYIVRNTRDVYHAYRVNLT